MRIVCDMPNVPKKDYFDLIYKIYGMAASEGLFDDKRKSQRALALKAVLDILRGIVKGKQLPEGYGRLIDGDRLFNDLVDGYESVNWDEVDARDIIEKIESAPTIIEPYKAESEVRPC